MSNNKKNYNKIGRGMDKVSEAHFPEGNFMKCRYHVISSDSILWFVSWTNRIVHLEYIVNDCIANQQIKQQHFWEEVTFACLKLYEMYYITRKALCLPAEIWMIDKAIEIIEKFDYFRSLYKMHSTNTNTHISLNNNNCSLVFQELRWNTRHFNNTVNQWSYCYTLPCLELVCLNLNRNIIVQFHNNDSNS